MKIEHLMRNRLTQILWSKINSIYYKGVNVICSLCGWKGIEFINRKCPNCNSLPRQRLIPVCINGFIPNKNKILHIAPNFCEYLYVKKNLKPDIYDRVDKVKTKYINILHDITKKGMNEDYYDLIIIWHVFEHIVDDISAIHNLEKCLNKRGSLLVSVPIFPKGNQETYEDESIPISSYADAHGHPDHYRSCGLDYWKRFLENGYTRVDTFRVAELDEEEKGIYGLSDNHVAWLFHKN